MDHARFDHLTRQLARHANRRTTAKVVAAAAAALLATVRGDGGGASAQPPCQGEGASCVFVWQCCVGYCEYEGMGFGKVCKCAHGGDFCNADADCCSGQCIMHDQKCQ